MRVEWLWVYFIHGLRLLPDAASPLLYHSINIVDLDDPVNFIKTLGIRLGWVIGQMEGCLFVLSKRPCELRTGHRISAPSLLMLKLGFRSNEFHLSFYDSRQQGHLDMEPTKDGLFFKITGRLVDAPEFNKQVADLLYSIDEPGDFPLASHSIPVHSSDSDSE
jgi:hypothetical protein